MTDNNFLRLADYIEEVYQNDFIINHDIKEIWLFEESIAFDYKNLSEDFIIDNNSKDQQKRYHQLRNNGITLYTIFENEWMTKEELVKSMIRSRLNLITNKIYARNCTVSICDKKISKPFFDENHISGNVASKEVIGLFHNDELVSAMSFLTPRYNKNVDMEIGRFASKMNTVIVGGASKIFNYYVNNNPNINSMCTFSDLRWGEGKVYENLGFIHNGYSNNNYFYYLPDTYKLLSRVKFQKHKLKDALETFDPNIGEKENMRNNGYRRIHDCGNAKYIWNRKNIS